MNQIPTLPSNIKQIVPEHQWQKIDFISDFHLNNKHPKTVLMWQEYLNNTSADAVFMLGDIFDAWIGDDAALDYNNQFFNNLITTMQKASERINLFYMHGNRDFMVGERFITHCNLNFLPDPTILNLGSQCWLLSHGDALCIDDYKYIKFRNKIRNSKWQKKMLDLPLWSRKLIANVLRIASKQSQKQKKFIDINNDASLSWLEQTNCNVLLHGHTHKPNQHKLNHNKLRIVLSDWEFDEDIVRAEIFRLTRDYKQNWSWQRLKYNKY